MNLGRRGTNLSNEEFLIQQQLVDKVILAFTILKLLFHITYLPHASLKISLSIDCTGSSISKASLNASRIPLKLKRLQMTIPSFEALSVPQKIANLANTNK